MKVLHPAAIVGFLLNGLTVLMLTVGANSVAPGDLGAEEQVLLEVVNALRPILILLLLVQGTALLLLTRGLLLGLVMGCVAGSFMLPIGLVFILGCVMTHYTVKYKSFTAAAPGYQGASRVFRSSFIQPFWIASAVSAALMVMAGYTGYSDLSVGFCGFALGFAYLASRAASHAPLALFGEHFTVTPSPVARRLALPYDAVLRATLFDNGGIQFDMRTPQGEQSLLWSLNQVRGEERREALESLGGILTERGVPLR